MTHPVWRTAAGVLVEERGRVTLPTGAVKVHAYKLLTGGYHGLLWLDKLKPVNLLAMGEA